MKISTVNKIEIHRNAKSNSFSAKVNKETIGTFENFQAAYAWCNQNREYLKTK